MCAGSRLIQISDTDRCRVRHGYGKGIVGRWSIGRKPINLGAGRRGSALQNVAFRDPTTRLLQASTPEGAHLKPLKSKLSQ